MLGLEVSLQCALEFCDLGAHACPGMLGDDPNVLLAGEQRLEHLARAAAQHIGGDRGQRDVGRFEDSRFVSCARACTRLLR